MNDDMLVESPPYEVQGYIESGYPPWEPLLRFKTIEAAHAYGWHINSLNYYRILDVRTGVVSDTWTTRLGHHRLQKLQQRIQWKTEGF